MDVECLNDQYTDLEVRVKEVPIEATKGTFEKFTNLIGEGDQLITQVKSTEGVIKDAYVLSALTTSIYESTKCITISESHFDPETFANAIVNLVNNTDDEEDGFREYDWAILAEKSAAIYKYAPGFTFISAFQSNQPSTQAVKVVERKERLARKPLEQRKEPEKVKTITKTDEGASGIDKIFKILERCFRRNGKQPICFFQFVIDPTSFSKTIENIFHVSFLARDGLVLISLDDRKLPILTPLPENINKKMTQENKIQLLMSITQDQWKEIVRDFDITEAIIP